MSVLLLLAVFVLVLLNGFFVAAEFALVRSRRGNLQAEAREGKRGAATAVRIMDDLSRYLSACQVGITLTSLGIGFLGEPAVADLVEPLFGDLPHWATLALSFTIAYLLTTSLHITIGEQVPKIYSIQKAERVAIVVARPRHLFARIFHPFVVVLNGASNALLRLIGVQSSGGVEEGKTVCDTAGGEGRRLWWLEKERKGEGALG